MTGKRDVFLRDTVFLCASLGLARCVDGHDRDTWNAETKVAVQFSLRVMGWSPPGPPRSFHHCHWDIY